MNGMNDRIRQLAEAAKALAEAAKLLEKTGHHFESNQCAEAAGRLAVTVTAYWEQPAPTETVAV